MIQLRLTRYQARFLYRVLHRTVQSQLDDARAWSEKERRTLDEVLDKLARAMTPVVVDP